MLLPKHIHTDPQFTQISCREPADKCRKPICDAEAKAN